MGIGSCVTVSILVLVDDGRRREEEQAEIEAATAFQSLFLWMTVVDSRSVRHVLPAGEGFNPCSCG